ncbi:fus1 actin binding activity protein [Fusarium sp. DS 682]|nr:fus1 actin binding activity protein [Fusarium sp. DS 682]
MGNPRLAKEPIAIIGTSCRFPGGANNPSKLWDLICEKRDVQSIIPNDRFNIEGFYSPNGEKSGCTDVKKAYLLSEDIRVFDAAFFKINPREAEAMDPQQRLLLEAVYEATEAAGLPMEDLKGSDTAVYVGCMTGDYHEMLIRDPHDMPKYMATGTARSILSNRISYLFDWKGPSMTIDTACSSSLVAVYDAVTALRNGVSRIACAGGSNLILGPEMMISESKLHMLSPTGRSRMWDASADGYARGEGVAAIMMKTLSHALEDGDHIHGIIREIGVNSDGRTNGITLPSPDAQKALIRQTYMNAGLDVFKDYCQFFEAHGTGTPAGDPLEARAIHEAFFADGDAAAEPMYVGSVKTAVGHLEGCAGLAGLLKALEAVKRGIIPPNQLFENINPAIKPYTTNLKVPTEVMTWPALASGSPRRASVNSFGFGGTNVHAIIEHFDNASLLQSDRLISTPLLLSANSENSLRMQIPRFAEEIEDSNNDQVHSIIFTLAHRRSQLPFRTFLSSHDNQSLKKKLKAAMDENTALPIANQVVASGQVPRVLAVFTGQGAQWPTMGREILKASQFARDLIAFLENSLASLDEPPTWTLTEQIMADTDDSRLNEAAISQPLCTAVQIMVVELLRKAGIKLDGVIGHSSGEITAAYAAGFLSARDAIRVAYLRGVCASLAGGEGGAKGSMMAVGLSYEEASSFCSKNFPGLVDVAASNAPASTTLSGDKASIDQAKALLDEQGTFARVLKVDTAYHSHHMLPCAEPYLDLLQSAKIKCLPGDESVTWYSSVLGERMTASLHGDALAGEYWVENMVNPVLFSVASELVAGTTQPCHVALEVGPHPALKGPFSQTYKRASGSQLPYKGTLVRNIHDVETLSDTLGFLWSHLGKSAVDFTGYNRAFNQSTTAPLAVGLPTYAWDHTQSFWKESRKSLKYRQRAQPPHPLLGSRSVEDTADSMRWLNYLRLDDVPWLEGHKVEGQVVFPAAGYLVMAMEAARSINQTKNIQLVDLFDVHILSAIQLIEGSHAIETVFTVEIEKNEMSYATARWALSTPISGHDDSWKCNAKGQLRVQFGDSNGTCLLPPRNKTVASLTSVDVERFYTSLANIGLEYTGEFKHLSTIERQLGLATAHARQIIPNFSAMIHPALLDSAFQSIFAAYCWPDDGMLQAPFVPTFFRSLRIINTSRLQHGEELTIDSFLTDTNERELTADMDIFRAGNGEPILQLQGLTCTSLLRPGPGDAKELYTKTEWEVDITSGIASSGTQDEDTSSDLELVDLCERLSYFYLRDLNRKVGREELRHFDWHFQRIFEWIDVLFPAIESGNHPTVKKEWSGDSLEWLMQQATKFPGRIDLQLIQAVGENLPAVVRKQTTMLEHMVKDDMLNRIYKYGLGFERANVYLGRISKQIAHRYPRMNILEIGAGTGGATKGILDSLGTTFATYTFTDISTGFFEAAAEAFEPWAAKMIFKPLNIEKDPVEQGFPERHYDFIIASNVLHATKSLAVTLQNTRKLLKPGGQLLLLEVTSDIIRVKLMMSGLSGWWLGGEDGRRYGPTIPVSQWDSLLKETGFSGVDKTVNDFVNEEKYMTSVMLSQAIDDRIQVLRQPLAVPGDWLASQSITIIGGKYMDIAKDAIRLMHSMIPVQHLLTSSRTQPVIQCIDSFEHLVSSTTQVRSALVLEDLDDAILRNLTDLKLRGVQRLMNECRQVLWVSRGCQRDDPFANMSIGMCRSLSSEYQHIHLQHIDIEATVTSRTASGLVEALIQLIYGVSLKSEDLVWSIEAELMLRDDQWFIPRVKTDQALNDQLNASKMKIQTQKLLEKDTVEIQRRRGQFSIFEPIPALPLDNSSPLVEIIVTKSLLYPFQIGPRTSGYLCYGFTASKPERNVLAVSEHNKSRISVPPFFVWDLSSSETDPITLLRKTALAITADRLLSDIESGAVVLIHEPDDFLGAALRWKASELGLEVFLTTSDCSRNSSDGAVFIHSLTPERIISKVLPQNVKMVIDLSCNDYSIVDSPLYHNLPSHCKFYQLRDIFGGESGGIADPIIHGVRDASRSSLIVTADGPAVKLSGLTNRPASVKDYATIVDFRTDTTISAVVQPLDGRSLFRSDKTYLLVGCTGGLGKALCRWMVTCGVRHLALTTRNVASVDKVWLEELHRQGARVNLYQADVSDKQALSKAYNQIIDEMPPVCGAANAALLLSDRTFSELKVDDFNKVFGPKVKGTLNLHELLIDQKLDFFIMFSSLASVVGNRGQANYAAANLFMSAIAEQRRARGLVGSVMHIGMVLGVGYVSSTGAYEATLRNSNYMAISEMDLLNMFSQAILVGQPDSGHAPELITGLNRFSLDNGSQKYFWRDNMRFSHHTVQRGHQERSSTAKVSITQRLSEAKDTAEALAIIEEEFCTKLERLLQAETGSVKASQSLLGLGVDSLVAAEIRSWFLKELDVDTPVLEILNTSSISELCSTALHQLPESFGKTETQIEVAKEAAKALDPFNASKPASSTQSTVNEPLSARTSPNTTQVTSEVDTDEDMSETDREGPLSFAQERLWFLQQFLRNPTTYNVTMHYRISGPLRVGDLEKAFQQVIQRHESLRTSFYMDSETNRPRQRVHRQSPFKLELKQNSTASIEYDALQAHNYDLKSGDVIRAIILANSDGAFELIFGFHHIALDGYSAQIMVRDLAMAYAGQTLPAKTKDYLDFAITQKVAQVPRDTVAYWKSEFEELPPTLPLFDFAETKMRIPLTDYTTRALERTLSTVQGGNIKVAATRLGVTPFHIHVAALQAALFDLASVKDLCLGVTDANRSDSAHMETVGFFVNLLPLRLKSLPSQSLADLASNAKSKANSALSHSEIPFDVLLDELNLPRSTTHSPLFQVVLNYKMGSTQKVPIADCMAELVEFKDADNPYDLTFDIETYPDGSASIILKSQEYLYTESELNLVLDSYVHILDLFSSEPSQALSDICEPTAEQIRKALSLGRGERIPSPRLDTLSHYFEDCVHRQPEETAIRTDDGRSLTWCQLKALVNQIVVTLVDAGVEQGSRVGVYCEPSVFIVASLMAIAEASGVYVPLDTQNPIKRLQLMVDDCQPSVILVDESTADAALDLEVNAKLVNVGDIRVDLTGPHVENRARGNEMAYIFYTSGTTGVPKAVVLNHTSLVHHFDGFIHYNKLKRCLMLQQAPLGFDMSLTQMALTIMLGGTLIVASRETRKDPKQIAHLMLSEKVTHTFMTPTLALSVIHHGYDYLRQCVDWEHASLAGEAMPAHLPVEFQRLGLRKLGLYNGYGPTEITIICTCGPDELKTTHHDTQNPSIGRPLPNYSCYILDDNLQPVKPGFAGELVVGGCGVAMGYLNKKDLTDVRFLPDPFASDDDVARGWVRMYRTGDKARLLSDGRLSFLGRIDGDTQIKLRGFRIELEDIANTIIKTSNGVITEAAVSLRQGDTGYGDSAYLVAFAVISKSNQPDDVKSYLNNLLKDLSLPRYMIPARIIPIERLPMNASGKLDQYSLDTYPLPVDSPVVSGPLTDTQERLKLCWLKVLPPVDTAIGSDTDFFTAGGNSLRIVSLREYITHDFGVTLSVFDLFQASTLGEMAAKIDSAFAQVDGAQPIDWDEETQIDGDISSVVDHAPSPSSSSDSLEVVITGSTGFLGLSILKTLLKDSRVSKVHCIAIRSSSQQEDPAFYSSRVVCYPGDLTLPRLGLSQDQFDLLSKTADRIIHNGADVSFLKRYQSLRQANVASTKEIALIAMRRRIPVHFVSTGGVVNLTGQDGLYEVSVSDCKPATDGSNGYVASKWASEHILEAFARQYNLPVWIHRPANITGENAPKADLMQNIFHFSIKTSSLPDLTSWKGYFDFVPVETVAADIVSSIHETQDRVVYRHHCSMQKIPVGSLRDYLESKHGTIETVCLEEWLKRAKDAGLDPITAAMVEKILCHGGGIVPWLRKGIS